MTVKKRVFYIDLLRAIAILAIVATHVAGKFAVNNPEYYYHNFWYFSIILRWSGWIAVPIFLMITGALLFNRHETITLFLKKRFKRVLVPAIFWMIVFLVFIFYCHNIIHFLPFNDEFTIDILLKTFLGKVQHGAVYWYVPVILVIYIAIAIINRLSDRFNVNLVKYLCYISILIVIIHQFHPILKGWSVENSLSYMIFPIFGYMLHTTNLTDNGLAHKLNITNEKITVISLIIIIVTYCQLIYIAIQSLMDSSIYVDLHFSLLNIICCVSIFIFFKYFEKCDGILESGFNFIKNNFSKVILSLSICSYGIYLSHIMIKFVVMFALPSKLFDSHLTLCVIVWFVLTTLISWILILTLSKIPYLDEISGTK